MVMWGDIEHACIGAHHMVLFQLGTVVDGHLPTVEVHHLGTRFQVFRMQYSSLDHRFVFPCVRDNTRNPPRLVGNYGPQALCSFPPGRAGDSLNGADYMTSVPGHRSKKLILTRLTDTRH